MEWGDCIHVKLTVLKSTPPFINKPLESCTLHICGSWEYNHLNITTKSTFMHPPIKPWSLIPFGCGIKIISTLVHWNKFLSIVNKKHLELDQSHSNFYKIPVWNDGFSTTNVLPSLRCSYFEYAKLTNIQTLVVARIDATTNYYSLSTISCF